NAALATGVTPGVAAVNVYAVPASVTARSSKRTMPPIAFLLVVPTSVAPEGLAPSVIVTAAVDVVTTFPKPSWTATVGGATIGWPAVVWPGWTVNVSAAGGPAMMFTGVAPVFPSASVATRLVVSATVPLAFSVSAPAVRALVASPKLPSTLLSNSRWPDEEDR